MRCCCCAASAALLASVGSGLSTAAKLLWMASWLSIVDEGHPEAPVGPVTACRAPVQLAVVAKESRLVDQVAPVAISVRMPLARIHREAGSHDCGYFCTDAENDLEL